MAAEERKLWRAVLEQAYEDAESTVADKLPSTQIIQVFADSQNGNAGYYVPVQGSALNNWKLKVFTGGGTEISAGAYPSSVTSDLVQITISARKLQ